MKFLLVLFLLLIVCARVSAQEVQVPFDSNGTVQVVNEDLEKKLDLFPSYPHFLEAHLYREPDSSFVLEITSFVNSQLTRDRIPKTSSQVASLRANVDARLGPREPIIKLDQSSRTKFVVWETLLSFFGYAPAIISSFNSDNGGVSSGLELIIGGSGYLLSSVLTQNAPMTDGEGSLALGGAFLGAMHGVLLDELLSNGNTGLEIGPIATAASIAETGIGYAIASKNNMTEGTADIIRYGGLFGMIDGLGLAFAVDNSASTSLWSGLSLVGSAVGFAAGAAMANNQAYTRGNASAVLTAGYYGTLLPPLLYASIISYNTSTNPATALLLAGVAGNIGGIALTNSLLKGRQFSNWEGTEVILGTTAGFVIGEGVGLILTSSSRFDTSPWALTLPIVIGTAAGFGITVASIGKGTGDKPSTGWNFEANSGALMGALLPASRINSSNNYVPPVLTVRAEW